MSELTPEEKITAFQQALQQNFDSERLKKLDSSIDKYLDSIEKGKTKASPELQSLITEIKSLQTRNEDSIEKAMQLLNNWEQNQKS